MENIDNKLDTCIAQREAQDEGQLSTKTDRSSYCTEHNSLSSERTILTKANEKVMILSL